MNNPLTSRPDAALLPHPVNSAGWRLWRMCHDHNGVSRSTYRRSYEFVNLCDSTWWDPLAARAKRDALWPTWTGRRVVLCGVQVLTVCRLQRPPRFLQWSEYEEVRWCWIPHPSGLTRDYNDPMMRMLVALRLEELAQP